MNLKKIEENFRDSWIHGYFDDLYDSVDFSKINNFFTQQITELLMDMPLEEMNGDDLQCECDGSGNDLNGFCNCGFSEESGYNQAIQDLEKWRANKLGLK